MVADSTKFNADIDDAMNALGQGSLPLYVVYPADGSEPKILPQVLTPSIVVNALTQASGKKT
jgi:thiol:disulfide interchange protein DsbD